MSTQTNAAGGMRPYGLEVVKEYWKWFLALGILLIVLGVLAIALPAFAALAVEIFLGWLLLIGGVAQCIHAFSARRWGGFLLQLLNGALYIVAGALLLAFPLQGVLTLTLVLAALFVVEGAARIVMAFRMRPMAQWGWVLLSGILAVILGVLIWIQWPSAAAWAIGLLAGINFLFGGTTMLMLALAARRAGG